MHTYRHAHINTYIHTYEHIHTYTHKENKIKNTKTSAIKFSQRMRVKVRIIVHNYNDDYYNNINNYYSSPIGTGCIEGLKKIFTEFQYGAYIKITGVYGTY
jgi:hypothetical protein